jgi:hypothetical protein
MMLICALGFAGCVASADDQTGAVEQHTGGSSGCHNNSVISGVTCVQSISILDGLTHGLTVNSPVNVDIHNVANGNLSDNYLNILSGDLNDLSISDVNVLDYNKILNDAQATVLNDFLTKFSITGVDDSKIDACALIGILQVCK